jgi:sarcosine oxidase
MNSNHYDVIVIGIGSMGSSACYYLASQGLGVLGLEQFTIPNEKGSHGGQSRIIRKAYFEHADYVPLLEKAYKNWNDLEKITGERLYFKTGLLYHGPKDHPVIEGVKYAGELYNIPLQKNPSLQTLGLFEFSNPGETIFEPDAGFLLPGRAIELYVEQASAKGAVIQTGERVIGWEKTRKGIKVQTEKDEYLSEKLVITAGAWTGKVSSELTSHLKVTRQLLIWMKPGDPDQYQPESFPCWMIADNDIQGVVYGFPYLNSKQFGEPEGLKAAVHFPGLVCDPDNVDRKITKDENEELFRVIKNYLPGMKEVVGAKTCLYMNSGDENFIIDFLPGYDNDVVVACGFSGHGFKFVSVVGEILADLAIKGNSQLPIGFLSLGRFK